MKKKAVKFVAAAVVTIVVVYVIFIYCLVSACLVPSFMEKLDAFAEITAKGYSQQVHTSDISENRKAMIGATNEWLAQAQGQKLKKQTADGYELVATEFFAKEESHKWVLLLHGYTGWKEELYPFAYWYYEQGYHVLVPDLRAQGESGGDFIGMGWTDSADCGLWLDYILSRDKEADIVLHGQSMGASTALIMSGTELQRTLGEAGAHIRAVISDCAYTDAYEMFGDKITEWFGLPPFPFVDSACLMLRLRGGYDLRKASALDGVKTSRVPTLFIHGKNDALIDVGMAYELYDAAACEKELLIVEGAGHAQSQDKDPEGYYGAILQFLGTYGM
ncbi:alpha/beta hydrolase [Lachnospiraceae bacterium 47-T17]